MTTPVTFHAPGPTTDQTMVQPRRSFLDRFVQHHRAARARQKSINPSILGFCLVFGLISGCTSEPFIDGRREAGSIRPIGPSTANRVAICYNSRTTTPEAVKQLAESECAKTDRFPQYDGEDIMDCSIASPTRAYFLCVTTQLLDK